MSYRVVLLNVDKHETSDMLKSYDDAVLWAFCYRRENDTCLIYAFHEQELVTIYVRSHDGRIKGISVCW